MRLLQNTDTIITGMEFTIHRELVPAILQQPFNLYQL